METRDILRYIKDQTTKVKAGDKHTHAYVPRAITKVNRELIKEPNYPNFENAKGCERIKLTSTLVRRVKGWKAEHVTTA